MHALSLDELKRGAGRRTIHNVAPAVDDFVLSPLLLKPQRIVPLSRLMKCDLWNLDDKDENPPPQLDQSK